MTCSSSHSIPSYLIIGCGQFGSRAVRILLKKNPEADITVADRDPKALNSLKGFPVLPIQTEGLPILTCLMESPSPPEWIIPAIPIHLAFHWIIVQLKRQFTVKIISAPEELGLPNPIRGRNGTFYASFAEFICPEDCPEPEGICTVTGEDRPFALFELLQAIKPEGMASVVIRSEQLAPGVGGYRSRRLRRSLAEIEAVGKPTLISTACRCHGVMNALTIIKRLGNSTTS